MIRNTYVRVLILTLVLASLIGCTHNWKSDSVVAYEAGSITLNTIKDATIKAYQKDLITLEQYDKVKDLYNKAVDAYVICGKTLKAAMNTEDVIAQKTLMTQYKTLLTTYQDIYIDLIKLITELKVKV